MTETRDSTCCLKNIVDGIVCDRNDFRQMISSVLTNGIERSRGSWPISTKLEINQAADIECLSNREEVARKSLLFLSGRRDIVMDDMVHFVPRLHVAVLFVISC